MAVRRLLPLILAGCATGPIPACITVSGTATPVETARVKPPAPSEFSIFPKRPGEVVFQNTVKTETHVSRQVEPEVPGAVEPVPAPQADPPIAPDPQVIPAVAIPPATESPLLAALRAYLDNRPEDAIRLLQPLDRASQENALALMPLLVRGTQHDLSKANPAELALVVEQLHDLASRWESKAALKVEKVAFCRKVTGFGRFEPWSEGQPYKPNDLAVLYVELRNLGSEAGPGPSGESYVSRAHVSLEVRDATGKLVEQTDPSDWRKRVSVARFEHVDHTRSPLHDYSRTYRISVPTQPGVYTVTVEVKDQTGKRVARSQPTEFRVAGP